MRTQEWVSLLPSYLSLSKVSWPGTHDSCARHGVGAVCQTWSITEQLNNGIRFLDIRARYTSERFAIHHGIYYQEIMFGDVVNQCRNFLNRNSNEVILMSLDEEHSDVGLEKFERVLRDYINENYNLWYTSSRIPTLEEVRGKIVLIRRWKANGTLGIAWNSDNVQDMYDLTKKEYYHQRTVTGGIQVKSISTMDSDGKWGRMVDLFNKARNFESEDKLFVNFGSGYWLNPLPIIEGVADRINPKIKNYMRDCITNNTSNFGCIVPMDFPEQKVIDTIIFQTYHRHGLLKRCRVYSHYRNEYLYAAGSSELADKRRGVFTYVGGSYDSDMVWWLIGSIQPGLFWFHCENHKEYMYGSEIVVNVDRHKVFTWEPGTDPGKAGWTIRNSETNNCSITMTADAFSNCTIKNTEFGEYLYAASDNFITDGKRRKVFCWIKNKEFPVEGYWRIYFI
jgi:1-phosphatidylinositol phosphodiesterase